MFWPCFAYTRLSKLALKKIPHCSPILEHDAEAMERVETRLSKLALKKIPHCSPILEHDAEAMERVET